MLHESTTERVAHTSLHDHPWETLVYQIIGHHELSKIKIPGLESRTSIHHRHIEQHLLEIAGILESVRTIIISKRDQIINVAPELLLRVIAFVCKLASSPLASTSECAVRRRCTLNVLVCATRIVALSTTSWSPAQAQWVHAHFQNLVSVWETQETIPNEEVAMIQEILMSTLPCELRPLKFEIYPSTLAALGSQTDSSAAVDIHLGTLEPKISYPSAEVLPRTSFDTRRHISREIGGSSIVKDQATEVLRTARPDLRPMSTTEPQISTRPVDHSISSSSRRTSLLSAQQFPSRKPLPPAGPSYPHHVEGRFPQKTESTIQAGDPLSPVELPTRIPINNTQHLQEFPKESFSSLEVSSHQTAGTTQTSITKSFTYDPGLIVVQAPSFSKVDYVPHPDAQSIRSLSSTGSKGSRTALRNFIRKGSSSKPIIQPLPSSLEFTFSVCARHLWLWSKKGPDSFVRLRHPFTNGEHITIQNPQGVPTVAKKIVTRSIRHLSSTEARTVAVIQIEEINWLCILHENVFHPHRWIEAEIPATTTFDISPDGRHVALGCGNFTLVYSFVDNQLGHPQRLYSMEDRKDRTIKAQRLSFSAESDRLVSAIQIAHSAQQDAAHVTTWMWTGSGFQVERRLDEVLLTVGYSGDTGIGITTVSLVNSQQVFLTAALSKKYHALLPLQSKRKLYLSGTTEYRINNAAQCQIPASSHVFAVQSGRHNVDLVDGKAGTTARVADFSTDRMGLDFRNGCMALAVMDSKKIFAVWRTRDEGIVLKTCVEGKVGKWKVGTSELGLVYRHIAGIS